MEKAGKLFFRPLSISIFPQEAALSSFGLGRNFWSTFGFWKNVFNSILATYSNFGISGQHLSNFVLIYLTEIILWKETSIYVKYIDAKQSTGCLNDKYVARCCSFVKPRPNWAMLGSLPSDHLVIQAFKPQYIPNMYIILSNYWTFSSSNYSKRTIIEGIK